MPDKLPPFHIMAKPRGPVCNLDCRYCYYLSKESLYPGSDFRMSGAVLESFTRQYLGAQDAPEITFAWQGGEPTLMGLSFFQNAVRLQKQYNPPGTQIHNTIQTNAVLLDDAWCTFFRENDFLVGVSLDGPTPLHDRFRLDKGGEPTFEKVMAGVRLLKQHRVDFNILTCVHAANAGHPLEVYRFLRDEVGARYIQFIPIVERLNESGYQQGFRVSRRSVRGEPYGIFLTAIFNEWLRHDVGQVFVQIFDVALGAWLGQPASLCIFSQTCGRALALEHNGSLYACDHYVEPDFLLGNIQENDMAKLVSSHKQVKFGLDKSAALPRYCRECPVRFVCNGGCPKNRIRRAPDGEEGLNYLCAGYRSFFAHIGEPMKIMAGLLRAGRPAAEVMAIKH